MIKRNNNLDKNKTINRRLFILGTAKAGLLGLITSRLYNLQISEKKNMSYYLIKIDLESGKRHLKEV